MGGAWDDDSADFSDAFTNLYAPAHCDARAIHALLLWCSVLLGSTLVSFSALLLAVLIDTHRSEARAAAAASGGASRGGGSISSIGDVSYTDDAALPSTVTPATLPTVASHGAAAHLQSPIGSGKGASAIVTSYSGERYQSLKSAESDPAAADIFAARPFYYSPALYRWHNHALIWLSCSILAVVLFDVFHTPDGILSTAAVAIAIAQSATFAVAAIWVYQLRRAARDEANSDAARASGGATGAYVWRWLRRLAFWFAYTAIVQIVPLQSAIRRQSAYSGGTHSTPYAISCFIAASTEFTFVVLTVSVAYGRFIDTECAAPPPPPVAATRGLRSISNASSIHDLSSNTLVHRTGYVVIPSSSADAAAAAPGAYTAASIDRSSAKGPARPSVGFFGAITFDWINPVMKTGRVRPLELDDMPPLYDADCTRKISTEFAALWAEEQVKVEPSLFRAFWRAFGTPYVLLGVLKFITSCVLFVGPILLQLLVTFIDDCDPTQSPGPPPAAFYGYLYAGGLVAGVVLSAVLGVQYSFRINQLAMRVRTALITRVFDKVLTLSAGARRRDFSVGQITTIMSVDTQRVMDAGMSVHEFWSLPLQIAIALYLLWTQVGVTLCAGVGIVVCLIPVNALLTKKISAVSQQMMTQKDKRVELTNEMLQQIRIIKLLALEVTFVDRINTLRAAEVASLKTRKYLDALCVYFWATTPVLVSLATFALYSALGNPLTAAKVFSCLALFNTLIRPLNAFPWVINGLVEARVSAVRVYALLTAPDRAPTATAAKPAAAATPTRKPAAAPAATAAAAAANGSSGIATSLAAMAATSGGGSASIIVRNATFSFVDATAAAAGSKPATAKAGDELKESLLQPTQIVVQSASSDSKAGGIPIASGGRAGASSRAAAAAPALTASPPASPSPGGRLSGRSPAANRIRPIHSIPPINAAAAAAVDASDGAVEIHSGRLITDRSQPPSPAATPPPTPNVYLLSAPPSVARTAAGGVAASPLPVFPIHALPLPAASPPVAGSPYKLIAPGSAGSSTAAIAAGSPIVKRAGLPTPAPTPAVAAAAGGDGGDVLVTPLREYALADIDFVVARGEFVGVAGAVGSGKSSLLEGILGEMVRVNGSVQVNGTVAYVSQEAWIENGTVRDNICFGAPYDPVKFAACVDACALTRDIQQLSGGEMTEIGERGINLSGGQKIRVSLARAVYQDADIYLLDDPLSAVDMHVGAELVSKCFLTALRGKTIVLVTHHLHALRNAAHRIVYLHNGRIARTPPRALQQQQQQSTTTVAAATATAATAATNVEPKKLDFDVDLKATPPAVDADAAANGESKAAPAATATASAADKKGTDDSASSGALVVKEGREVGAIRVSVLARYFAFIGVGWSVIIFVSMTLMQASRNFSDWWLGYWVSNEPANASGGPDTNTRFYLEILAWIGLANTVLTLIRSFSFAYGGLLAARNVYRRLVWHVIHASIPSFFDVQPVGRILNRFSSDTYAVDEQIAFMSNILLAQSYMLLGTVTIIALTIPLFVALTVPLSVGYYYLQRYYRCTSRELRRLDSVSRSPIYSKFSQTLTGAVTIRAFDSFGASDRFRAANEQLLDDNQRVSFVSNSCSQWLTFRLQCFGIMITAFVSFFAVYDATRGATSTSGGSFISISPATIGLALAYALPLTDNLNGLIGALTSTEQEIVSVERVLEYMDLPPEETSDTFEDDDSAELEQPLVPTAVADAASGGGGGSTAASSTDRARLRQYIEYHNYLQRTEAGDDTDGGGDSDRSHASGIDELYEAAARDRSGKAAAAASAAGRARTRTGGGSMQSNRAPAEFANPLLLKATADGSSGGATNGLTRAQLAEHRVTVGASRRPSAHIAVGGGVRSMSNASSAASIHAARAAAAVSAVSGGLILRPGSGVTRVNLSEWPSSGELIADRLTMRYRPGLPLALREVSFTIRSGERVGIVGRTGAGKSSLLQALFRIVDTERNTAGGGGGLYLDDVDISSVHRYTLRSRLSIIPQSPVLFTGSIRDNIDPYRLCDVTEIDRVLTRCKLAGKIHALPDGLETVVSDSANQFSLGEKQLLCLARAILKRGKIIALDEATAAVDLETDSAIHSVLRTEFAGATLLIIAHRMDTVMECHRVMVLEAGRIVEFDSPAALMQRADSHFASLVRSTAAAGARTAVATATVPAAATGSSVLDEKMAS